MIQLNQIYSTLMPPLCPRTSWLCTYAIILGDTADNDFHANGKHRLLRQQSSVMDRDGLMDISNSQL